MLSMIFAPVFSLAFSLALHFGTHVPEARAAETITVVHVKGEAQFQGRPLKAGESISSAGEIQLAPGAESLVDLKFSGGHRVRLKNGAQLKLASENTAELKSLSVLRGQAFLHFAKGPDAEKFKIHTRIAVAGVRGTKFLIEEKDGATYLCVCEGKVEFAKPDGKDTRLVGAGQDLWSRPDKPLAQPKDSPQMGNQTSAEFAAMDRDDLP